MAETQAHIAGEGYSEHNKVSSIKQVLANQKEQAESQIQNQKQELQNQVQNLTSADSNDTNGNGKETKEEVMAKATAHKTDPVSAFEVSWFLKR